MLNRSNKNKNEAMGLDYQASCQRGEQSQVMSPVEILEATAQNRHPRGSVLKGNWEN